MSGIMRKKYSMGKETQPKKSRRVKVKVGKRRVRKTIKQMQGSSYGIDKARMEVYQMQKRLQRRESSIKNRRLTQGLQSSLINEMYTQSTNYDVRSITSQSQANRIKKEIEKINRSYDLLNRKIGNDLRRLNNFMKKDKEALENRNRIIQNYMEEASKEVKNATRGDVMSYSMTEDVAGITGNPKRYFYKKDYEKERVELRRIAYDPHYKTSIYKKNVNANGVMVLENAKRLERAGLISQDDLNKMQKVFLLFKSLSNDEVQAFSRVNTYDTATLIMSSDPKIIRSNYDNFINIMERIKKANRKD